MAGGGLILLLVIILWVPLLPFMSGSGLGTPNPVQGVIFCFFFDETRTRRNRVQSLLTIKRLDQTNKISLFLEEKEIFFSIFFPQVVLKFGIVGYIDLYMSYSPKFEKDLDDIDLTEFRQILNYYGDNTIVFFFVYNNEKKNGKRTREEKKGKDKNKEKNATSKKYV